MRQFNVIPALGKTIFIGMQGENESTQIVINIAEWFRAHPDGTIKMMVQRPGEEMPYLASKVERDDVFAVWTVTSDDTAIAGDGQVELCMYDGDTIAKSIIMSTQVAKALGQETEAPSIIESWLKTLENVSATAEQAAETANEAAESATTAAEQAATTAESAVAAAESATTAAEQAAETANEAAEEVKTSAVLTTEQSLTDAQKEQARQNIATVEAVSDSYVSGTKNYVSTPSGAYDNSVIESHNSFIDIASGSSNSNMILGGESCEISNSTDYPTYRTAILNSQGSKITADEDFEYSGNNPICYSIIVGGSAHTISNSLHQNAIVGGNTNSMTDCSSHNAIVGGYTNSMTDCTSRNAIVGGQANSMTDCSSHNAIVGGYTNSMTDCASNNAIVGGAHLQIDGGTEGEQNGSNMVCVGGQYNETKTGAYLVVGAGTSDTARKDAFVVTSSGVKTTNASVSTISANDILIRDDDDTDLLDDYEVDVPDTEDITEEKDGEVMTVGIKELSTTHKETWKKPHMTGTSLKALLASKDEEIANLKADLATAKAELATATANITVLQSSLTQVVEAVNGIGGKVDIPVIGGDIT